MSLNVHSALNHPTQPYYLALPSHLEVDAGVVPVLHQRTRHYYLPEYTSILTSEFLVSLQLSSISPLGQYPWQPSVTPYFTCD